MTTDIPYWAAALYGGLAAAAILLGGGLVGPARKSGNLAAGLLASVGAGFLIALGLVGALPEAFERFSSPVVPGLLALASLGLMLFVHRAGHLHGTHAHGGHTDAPPELSLYDARMAVGGLALHSLLDGVAVSAALASHRELGFFVAFFVLMHKLPEGATAAALTYASGGESGVARRGVVLVAFASLLGALAIVVVGPVLGYALAVAAGVTAGVGIGIATHLFRHNAGKAALGMLAGALVFALTEWLLHR